MLMVPQSEAERCYESAPEVGDSERETLAIEEERFAVSGVVKPTPVVLKKPEVNNEFLMLPRQRKELQDYEIEQQKARSLCRRARADRKRMLDLMQSHHPTGVLGMQEVAANGEKDGAPGTTDRGTDVYLQIKRREEAKKDRLDQSMARVQATTVQWTDGMARRGYHFLSFEPEHATVEDKVAGMRGISHRPALSVKESRERLFKGDEPHVNVNRLEYLQSKDRGGKAYNILNGGTW